MLSVLPRQIARSAGEDIASLRVATADWHGYRTIAQWMFHTPAGVVPGPPEGVPPVAGPLTPPASLRVRTDQEAASRSLGGLPRRGLLA